MSGLCSDLRGTCLDSWLVSFKSN
uniref:Uncharacterized protein n=1 Tax=Anguilla anguilla TaxID=7936 RepID=A0A0E9WB25_ANGAN